MSGMTPGREIGDVRRSAHGRIVSPSPRTRRCCSNCQKGHAGSPLSLVVPGYESALGCVRPNRQWAVLYEHNRREPPMTYEREREMRNLTPDDKRIEESQQSATRETTEGDRVVRRGWSAAIERIPVVTRSSGTSTMKSPPSRRHASRHLHLEDSTVI